MDQICRKKVFLVENGKSEHHHWILYIQISIGTKFQLKLTILEQIYPKKDISGQIQKNKTSPLTCAYAKLFWSLNRLWKLRTNFVLTESSRPKSLLEKAVLKSFKKIEEVRLKWSASYRLMDSKFTKTALHN